MPSLLRPALLTFSAFLLAESLFGTLPAQGNWDRYRPGTITAIVELHDSTIRATRSNLLPTWVLPGNQFPTRAQVTYRGDSHPIDSTRREIVRRWGLSYLHDSSITASTFFKKAGTRSGYRCKTKSQVSSPASCNLGRP